MLLSHVSKQDMPSKCQLYSVHRSLVLLKPLLGRCVEAVVLSCAALRKSGL